MREHELFTRPELQLGDFATMARDMARQADLGHTLDSVVEAGKQAYLCDAVGILLVTDRNTVTTAAASEPDVKTVDELQMKTGQGPCLDAISRREDFVVDDLRTDRRWPLWAEKAAELGFRSVLSLGLGDGPPFGAVNMYHRRPSFFDGDDVGVGTVFAQHATIALANAREREQLMQAVEARHLVGQAQGILMERFDIDAEQSFTVLRRYSSHLNTKLRVVAEDIVRRRQLPEL